MEIEKVIKMVFYYIYNEMTEDGRVNKSLQADSILSHIASRSLCEEYSFFTCFYNLFSIFPAFSRARTLVIL